MTARALVDALPAAGGELSIEGDEHHYLFRVRRLAVDDALIVADAAGQEADARVLAVDATTARLAVGAPRDAIAERPRITVLQALIKGDRMEWCVEKLAECGADAIVLVASARAVVRLDGERASARRDRLASIAKAAARQSRRAVPAVEGPVSLGEALRRAAACDLRLVCHPHAHESPLHVPPDVREVALLVGPEGGLAADEVEAALAAGFEAVSLGRGVLRAETAGPVACAAIRIGRAIA